jgi:hypothetical protein
VPIFEAIIATRPSRTPIYRGLDMGLSNARNGRHRFGGGIER